MIEPVLLLAMEISNEVIGLGGLLLGAMAGALGLVYRNLYQSLREDRDNWKQMANEGIENLEKVAGRYQKDTKAKKVKSLAPVVPEHSSPPTEPQIKTAETQTARARMVAATLALDLESRSELEAKKTDIETAIGAAAVISEVASQEIGKLETKSKEKK